MIRPAIEAAFRAACADELAAPKPGNVHVHAAGHRMTVADFERSAEAAAGPLCTAGKPLGERVLGAAEATRQAAGQNTNLGIILLCAPLAMAAEGGADGLEAAVRRVLQAATLADTALVYRAILLAAPGGLGAAARHDVHGPATATLIEAMAEAAPRDLIARQYATGFADIFGRLLHVCAAAQARHAGPEWAALAVYLDALAAWPDTHVIRRHGAAAAAAIQARARGGLARLMDAAPPQALLPALLAWDAELKAAGLNPGASADLTVATMFAHRLGNSLP